MSSTEAPTEELQKPTEEPQAAEPPKIVPTETPVVNETKAKPTDIKQKKERTAAQKAALEKARKKAFEVRAAKKEAKTNPKPKEEVVVENFKMPEPPAPEPAPEPEPEPEPTPAPVIPQGPPPPRFMDKRLVYYI